MNYKHLLIAILAGAALVGCNKEQDKSADGLETDAPKNYMGFTISMPSAGTKAADTGGTGNFVYGDEKENQIKTIHFFFYNDGRYVSSGYGDMKTNFTGEEQSAGGSIEEIWHDGTSAKNGVVILESTMTEPNQVLCVINSRNPGFYKNKSLSEVMVALHSGSDESVTGNKVNSFKDFYMPTTTEGPCFVMFTSPMYGYNAKGDWEVKNVTDIVVDKDAAGHFTQKSHIQSEAKLAKANPVEIYVERIAARTEITNLETVTETAASGEPFGIFKADKYGDDMKEGGDPIWDIKPVAWSLTAVNKQSYDLKHVDLAWRPKPTDPQNSIFTDWIETLSEKKVTNPVFNYTYGTPQPEAYKMYPRINWCYDPMYDRAGERSIFPHSARELETGSAHKYYSAKEIAANFKAGDWDEGDMLQRYSYENTFDPIGQKDPRITGTMLLVYAQAKKHKPVPPATETNYEDIYNYMGQFQTYDEYATQLLSIAFTQTKVYKLEGTDYKLLTKDDLQIVKASKFDDVYGDNQASYRNDKNKPSTVVTTPSTQLQELYSNYIIDLTSNVIIPGETNLTSLPQMDAYGYYPIGDKSIEKSYSDGYVSLVPKATLYCNSPYATKVNELYVENPAHATDPSAPEYIKATDAQIADVFLGSVIDAANRYENGLMYYAIPIEHYGKADDGTAEKNPLEGNYGVVRNNFYQVVIDKISGMGHGIHDVNEPIVPGDRKKPYYLAAKINILSWQIATQKADLAE